MSLPPWLWTFLGMIRHPGALEHKGTRMHAHGRLVQGAKYLDSTQGAPCWWWRCWVSLPSWLWTFLGMMRHPRALEHKGTRMHAHGRLVQGEKYLDSTQGAPCWRRCWMSLPPWLWTFLGMIRHPGALEHKGTRMHAHGRQCAR